MNGSNSENYKDLPTCRCKRHFIVDVSAWKGIDYYDDVYKQELYAWKHMYNSVLDINAPVFACKRQMKINQPCLWGKSGNTQHKTAEYEKSFLCQWWKLCFGDLWTVCFVVLCVWSLETTKQDALCSPMFDINPTVRFRTHPKTVPNQTNLLW